MAAGSEHILKVRAELSNAVVVRPGDKLVIAFSRLVTQRDVDTIRTQLAGQLPGVEAVVVDGVSGLAVYRPDGSQ